jgi:hypothetical protein
MYLVLLFSVNITNTTNNFFPPWLLQHVSTHMSHHQANLEPLNISEFLLTVLFVSKAADRCVSSGLRSVLVRLSLPAGGEQLPTTEFLFQLTVCEGPKPLLGVFTKCGFEYCVILACQLVVGLVFGLYLSVYVEFFQLVHHFAFDSCVYNEFH